MRLLWRSIKRFLMVAGALVIGYAVAATIYNRIVHYQSTLNAWPDSSAHVKPVEWHPDDPKRVRILSIDGGGMHGIIFLEILKEFEQSSNQPISELFDFFAGPSTGSIISSSLLIPDKEGNPKYSVDDLIAAYTHLSQQILRPSILHEVLTLDGLFGPRLQNHTKFIVGHEMFGQTKFADLLRPAMIPVFSQAKQGFVMFRNWIEPEGNMLVAPLIAAATAVPAFFPAVQLRGNKDYDGLYTDAVFVMNNPAQQAFLHALERYPTSDFVIVSLGIGEIDDVTVQLGVDGGPLGWLQPLVSMILDGQNDVMAATFDRLETIKLPFKIESHRMAPDLPVYSDPMDASYENIELLKKIARDYVRENRAELDKVLALLTQKSVRAEPGDR